MPFLDVIGHERLVALLARAIARETLPPALLLGGPSGVGKKRVALALAAALNCLDPRMRADDGRDACGVCTACRRIARGVHPAVVLLAPDEKGTIGIETVRQVVVDAGYRPFEGRRRVVIIDEADAMTSDAQSALLKTLEEPHPGSVFLLVSSMPDALLATVRSRCPRLRFAGLAPADVSAALVRDHGWAPADATAAGADADGSIGRALGMRAADTAGAREAARDVLALVARGADLPARVQAAKDFVPKKNTPAAEREHLAVRLRALSALIRDLSILIVGGPASLLANQDLEAELARLGQRFDAERAARAYAAVDRALAALDRNANPKVVADWLVVRI